MGTGWRRAGLPPMHPWPGRVPLAKAPNHSGLSKTDIVNRAISLYELIDAEVNAEAELIVRRDGQDHIIKLL